jgi:hypothetical protein
MAFRSKGVRSTGTHSRNTYGRTALFSTNSIRSTIFQDILLKTEQILQKEIVRIYEEAADQVRENIEVFPVKLTGATLESVYVAYPPSWKAQSAVRDKSETTQNQLVSNKTRISYYGAKTAAQEKRPSLLPKIKQVDNSTGRPTKLASTGLTPKELPYNPLGNTSRGNLYAGFGVGTFYAIFPHEGIAGHAQKGPRRFFSPEAEQAHQDFEVVLARLERTVKGKLRI